jgi:hypothetical protein
MYRGFPVYPYRTSASFTLIRRSVSLAVDPQERARHQASTSKDYLRPYRRRRRRFLRALLVHHSRSAWLCSTPKGGVQPLSVPDKQSHFWVGEEEGEFTLPSSPLLKVVYLCWAFEAVVRDKGHRSCNYVSTYIR